jgi:hypothetical protein
MSDDIEKLIDQIKKKLLYKINNIIELELKDNEYIDNVIIDGIGGLTLYNDVSLFGSKPSNILILDDTRHSFKDTKINTDIYYKIGDLFYLSIETINKLTIDKFTKIKYIRELIYFVNENLYLETTNNLYSKKIISIDKLLYYNFIKAKECLDIFIENDIINLEKKKQSSIKSFLPLINDIFFNCSDKIIIEGDNIIETNELSLCNFNIRFHRSDIRKIYDNIAQDIYYIKKDKIEHKVTAFNDRSSIIIGTYLDYLFDISDETFENTSFYISHLKDYINKIFYEKLKNYYIKSKQFIIKQYNKSIFKNINIEDLKSYIRLTEINMSTYLYDTNSIFEKYNLNDIYNIKLTAITMNLYSIFRMFIDTWNKKFKYNVSDCCNNLEYPKNIIYFAGKTHNQWIINFINICKQHNKEVCTINISISKSFNSNYVILNNIEYIKLKNFFTIINIPDLDTNILDIRKLLYNKLYINILDTYFNPSIPITIEFIVMNLIDINNKLFNYKTLEFDFNFNNTKDTLLTYLSHIENIYNDIEYINEYEYSEDSSNISDDEDISDEEDIEGIKFYCDLLIRNINNSIILINYLDSKDINNTISYSYLLYFYNRNEYLNYIISTPENVLKYFSVDNIYLNNNDKTIYNTDELYSNLEYVYNKIIQYYNKENEDLLNMSNEDVIKYLHDFNFTAYSYDIDINNLTDINYYYNNNLYIFSNNIILILCYYYSKKFNNINCTYSNKIIEDKMYEQFMIGKSILVDT